MYMCHYIISFWIRVHSCVKNKKNKNDEVKKRLSFVTHADSYVQFFCKQYKSRKALMLIRKHYLKEGRWILSNVLRLHVQNMYIFIFNDLPITSKHQLTSRNCKNYYLHSEWTFSHYCDLFITASSILSLLSFWKILLSWEAIFCLKKIHSARLKLWVLILQMSQHKSMTAFYSCLALGWKCKPKFITVLITYC